ncbi:MAG: hypothetical protein ABSH53_16315 [Holophaga sp.]|jgi:putative intracellular protease/amidase
MTSSHETGRFGEARKGKIGVLIEDHFDLTEFEQFNAVFPERGYAGDGTADVVVDGDLISAKHPGGDRTFPGSVPGRPPGTRAKALATTSPPPGDPLS